jgi:hypothetical protein
MGLMTSVVMAVVVIVDTGIKIFCRYMSHSVYFPLTVCSQRLYADGGKSRCIASSNLEGCSQKPDMWKAGNQKTYISKC